MRRDSLTIAARGGVLDGVSSGLLGITWIVELANILHPAPLPEVLAASGLTLFTFLALLRASRHVRILFLIVLSTSIALAATNGALWLLETGLQSALVFGAFLPSILLLRATVQHSGRMESLSHAVDDLGPSGRVSWMLYSSHLLGAMLNVGAMAVLAPIAAARSDQPKREALAASSVRGLGTAVMWSPFFVAMGFVSHLIPTARIEQVMLLGGGLGVIGLGLAHAMFTRDLGWRGVRASISRMRPLITPMGILVSGVMLVVLKTSMNGTQAVAITLPVVCVVYLVVAGPSTASRTVADTLRSFAYLSDEMIIVVGSTILGAVVAHLPFTKDSFDVLWGVLAGWPLVAALIVGLVVSGLLGLHPMISASVLLPILAGRGHGVADIVLVEAAVFAWGLSATIAVWTMPVAVAASVFRVRVTTLGGGPNLAFGVLYVVCAIAYLALANYFLT
jgi:hypothetical protein